MWLASRCEWRASRRNWPIRRVWSKLFLLISRCQPRVIGSHRSAENELCKTHSNQFDSEKGFYEQSLKQTEEVMKGLERGNETESVTELLLTRA